MLIRPATPDDADDIAQVNFAGWRTAYRKLLSAEYLAGLSFESRRDRWQEILSQTETNKITFVAEIDGKVVGFLSCGPERTADARFAGEIYAIYVLEDHCRKGIGTALFRHGIDFLLSHHISSMQVWVLSDNPYRTFYERQGGQIADEKTITIGDAELLETAYGWESLIRFRRTPTIRRVSSGDRRKNEMSAVKCWQVDAFTNRPFGGNPAAICWLEQEADPAWMQAVAAEMNLSETAFVRPLSEGLELRWFTPMVEVDLCGHATLATAHALWSSDLVPKETPLRFHTWSGVLTCTRVGDFIELDFPATPAIPAEIPSELVEALGAKPTDLGRSRFDLLAVFDSEDIVRSLRPDFRKLERIPVRGVIVTAPSDDPKFDFVDRFFAPAVGVDEDPVCGSAHCCLTPYWAKRLGKTELMAHQVSARGGVLRLKHKGDRVILGGQAVTVWRGEFL